MTQAATDPLVDAPEEAREYFGRCARGELAVQRCIDCGTLRHYPRPLCTRCMSAAYEWRTCSGRATLYTFTVIRQNLNPRFRERLPYVFAVVELEEGVRMLSGLTGVDVDTVRVGMPLQVVFEPEPDGRTVPRFGPA